MSDKNPIKSIKEDDKDIENKNSRVRPLKIEEEMQKAYLDYAMSVIVARALPDARDGLKPVQRRIIYAAYSMGILPNSKFQKCAKIVGEVLGKYHPHSDASVYDALVRMAQDFTLRYPLIKGQGNFGSIDGDNAAAMRYTEAKLSKISVELLKDINEETVEFRPNYSGEYFEPTLLPATIPNLLLNGGSGIAVGMATNIPPHNLVEVLDATIHLIQKYKPDIKNKLILPISRKPFETEEDKKQREGKTEERQIPVFESTATVEDLHKFIKGPDFPTAGIIYNKKEILQMYATGKGKVTMRAKTNIEEIKGKKFRIIITELPFQVNKAKLVAKIADLVKQKKVEGIADLRDESDRTGLRVVIEIKQGKRPQKILNKLYKHTELQLNFNANFVALINNEPKVMPLKMILEEFVRHRQTVVIKRNEYRLSKLLEREHILQGLKIALDHIDEVIETIKKSKDTQTARANLMKKFKLTYIQAEAILDMQLRKLARLEREKIENELKEVAKKIANIKEILKSPKKILDIIVKELEEIKQKYGDKRKTKIVAGRVGEFSDEDLIPNEETIITFTKSGYVKRIKPSTYKKQHRGGKGVRGMTTKEADSIKDTVFAQTHDEIYFFTNTGRVYKKRVWDIPEGSRTSKGTNIVNLLNLREYEEVTGICTYNPNEKEKYKYLVFATKKGTIKKAKFKEYQNIRQNGLIAIKLANGDSLASTQFTSGNNDILITTKKGKAIRFSEKDVRPMGRSAGGVRGIRLSEGDEVISMNVFDPQEQKELYILTVSKKGYGKKTNVAYFTKQKRGGKGLKVAKITPKTGEIVDSIIVKNKGDLLLTSAEGQIVRIALNKVPTLSRSTQGVILMKFKGKDYLSGITVINKS